MMFCRFSRDHVVECSERTVLSCLEPVCLCWQCFGRYVNIRKHKHTGPTNVYLLTFECCNVYCNLICKLESLNVSK